ncbi:MAG: Omp28-related outer membrane protein [Bacteroidota bacterium]
MNKFIITIILSLYTCVLCAQTKKVLLEEFTGVDCGQCPMGSYTLDSLLGVYPGLIGVSLHTYSDADAMFFPEIDTIGIAYAPGAPLGATDRIFWPGGWGYVAEISSNWNARIQSRLAVAPLLTVSVYATWDSVSRNISAQITAGILANMPAGDYRFDLYVLEDSVTGTGPGYDQINFYNSTPGNPFFGMGDPIVGYIHRHVVRAILPQAWGQGGIIPSSPVTGQNFSTVINYTLPANYNENMVKLVAFVSKYTGNHQGDEVLNAEEINLPITSGIYDEISENNISVYPNPSSGLFIIKSKVGKAELAIYNMLGEKISTQNINDKKTYVDITSLDNGVYIIAFCYGANTTRLKIIKNTY